MARLRHSGIAKMNKNEKLCSHFLEMMEHLKALRPCNIIVDVNISILKLMSIFPEIVLFGSAQSIKLKILPAVALSNLHTFKLLSWV